MKWNEFRSVFSMFISVMVIPVFTGCNHSETQFPETITGDWHFSKIIEGSEGELILDMRIHSDTLTLRQQFPRLSGIDKVTSVYIAEKIQHSNDSVYLITTRVNNTEARISMIQKSNGLLHVEYCQAGESGNRDAEFLSCSDWGDFTKRASTKMHDQ